MPQSLAKISLHIVFSTKRRTPWLWCRQLQCELFAYMATILRDMDCPAMVLNGVEDHLHGLCLLSRKVCVMDLVKDAKTETSKWIKRQRNGTRQFKWQVGYGAFSVSESDIPRVRSYIQDQADHHRGFSFQDEFRALCRRHGIALDERYAWD